MAGGVVMFASSSRCRIQPLAVALLLVACLAGHACGSCLSYGHSCWGAHGKRSGGPSTGGSLLVADGSSEPLPPLAPLSSSSSSSPSDSEALWVLSKLMATKELESKDKGVEDGLLTDPKEFNLWQRLLDAKKERKSLGPLQAAGPGKTLHPSVPSESAFVGEEDILSMENARRAEDIERRNMLVSGEKSEREDEGDDLAEEDGEEEPSGEEEEEEGASGDKRKEGRRYRYKLQKHWANRKKNRRPYYHYHSW